MGDEKERVTVELSAEEIAILDELRKEEPGMTREDAIKAIIQVFGMPDKQMTLLEAARLVMQSDAREGKKPRFRFPDFTFHLD